METIVVVVDDTFSGADAPDGNTVQLYMPMDLVIENPTESYEPDAAMQLDHELKLRQFLKNNDDVFHAVEVKRSFFFRDMHGFNLGQTVYWSRRDENYGLRGIVADQSHHYETPCVRVRFKSKIFHCRTSNLSFTNPKNMRKRRRRTVISVIEPIPCVQPISHAEEDVRECKVASPRGEEVSPQALSSSRSRWGKRFIERQSRRLRMKEWEQSLLRELSEKHDDASDYICFCVAGAMLYGFGCRRPMENHHSLTNVASTPCSNQDAPLPTPPNSILDLHSSQDAPLPPPPTVILEDLLAEALAAVGPKCCRSGLLVAEPSSIPSWDTFWCNEEASWRAGVESREQAMQLAYKVLGVEPIEAVLGFTYQVILEIGEVATEAVSHRVDDLDEHTDDCELDGGRQLPRPPKPFFGMCCHLGHAPTHRSCERCSHFCCVEHGEDVGGQWVCGHCVWDDVGAGLGCMADWELEDAMRRRDETLRRRLYRGWLPGGMHSAQGDGFSDDDNDAAPHEAKRPRTDFGSFDEYADDVLGRSALLENDPAIDDDTIIPDVFEETDGYSDLIDTIVQEADDALAGIVVHPKVRTAVILIRSLLFFFQLTGGRYGISWACGIILRPS